MQTTSANYMFHRFHCMSPGVVLSVRFDFQVKLHPDFATGPAEALALTKAPLLVEPGNPVADPIHWRAEEDKKREVRARK